MADEIIILENPATNWMNDSRWGHAWKRPDPQILPGWGGLGTRESVTLCEAIPSGPPQLYEVRFGLTWAQDDPTWVPGVCDGLIQVEITSGVGSTTQRFVCDIGTGTSVVVPGGTVTIVAKQRSSMSRYIDTISASIAKAAGARSVATYSHVLVTAPDPVIPGYFDELVTIPDRAVSLRVHAKRAAKSVVVNFQGHDGTVISVYDSGSTPEVCGSNGVPVPPNCDKVLVCVGAGEAAIAQFVLL